MTAYIREKKRKFTLDRDTVECLGDLLHTLGHIVTLTSSLDQSHLKIPQATGCQYGIRVDQKGKIKAYSSLGSLPSSLDSVSLSLLNGGRVRSSDDDSLSVYRGVLRTHKQKESKLQGDKRRESKKNGNSLHRCAHRAGSWPHHP